MAATVAAITNVHVTGCNPTVSSAPMLMATNDICANPKPKRSHPQTSLWRVAFFIRHKNPLQMDAALDLP